MKGSQSGKKYRIYYLGLAVAFFWLITPVFAKHLLYRSMDLFHAPIQMVAAKAGELQDYSAMRLNSKNRLIEQNRRLARELGRARMENNRQHAVRNYVDRLERLLSLEAIQNHHPEYARVIRRDVNAWFEMILIDKGARHGLKLGMAVVSSDGLVGRVSDVGILHSKVTLISSPAFRVTVNTRNDDRPISFHGRGQLMWDDLYAEVQHVPQDIPVSEDQSVALYTSGLGDGIPAGIYVGELVSVEPELKGLFQKGEVRLMDSLRSLREVVVLIPLE